MNLISDEGILRCKLLSEIGLEKAVKSNVYEKKIVAGLRNGSSDYVYDEYWLDKIVDVLRPNEIIKVKKIKDYFKLSLTTYHEQVSYYKKWCNLKGLDERNAVNLKRFIKEVKIIWD